MIWHNGKYHISDEKEKLNVAYIHNYLSKNSYWAANIPLEIVKRSIDGSVCFGIYDNDGAQIGFARVVTDKATFGYLADVFVDEQSRGKGLSKWLMEVVMNYPQFQGLRRWMLGTRDAHGLYEKFGFEPLENPSRIMHIHKTDVYKKIKGNQPKDG
jgi:GNAT superfamily N-acetyltransferase